MCAVLFSFLFAFLASVNVNGHIGDGTNILRTFIRQIIIICPSLRFSHSLAMWRAATINCIKFNGLVTRKSSWENQNPPV